MRSFFFLFLFTTSLIASETPADGLRRLKEGNRRFVEGNLIHPRQDEKARRALVKGQSPYAVIVTCSDSRVTPEVLFDDGLGDLFVIRVAGNVISETELESVEYAVGHLEPVVVVVMGHQNCGAVKAVLQNQSKEIPAIASLIQPSVREARSMRPKDLLRRSIKLNALNMRTRLLESPVVQGRVHNRSIAVYAAYYNLKTGVVEFLDASNHCRAKGMDPTSR